MEMLNCGRNKAVNCLKELDQEKGIGLIEKRRIGLEKTNVIYVKNFSLTEYPDEPAIFDSEKTLENVAKRKENTETEIEEYAEKEPERPLWMGIIYHREHFKKTRVFRAYHQFQDPQAL